MKKLNNILLIGGNGQNVGKTTFICNIIKEHSSTHNIIAIKTSNHFHEIATQDIVIAKNDDFIITKETSKSTGKDTARMLNAGAKEVFFIQSNDIHIGKAFDIIYKIIDKNKLIICESVSLRTYFHPSIFIGLISSKNFIISDKKSILKKTDFLIVDYLEKIEKYTLISKIIMNTWLFLSNKN